MFQLLKDRGNNINLTLYDTTTCTYFSIGRLNTSILTILEEEGFKFNSEGIDGLSLVDTWELNISEETAKRLKKTTIPDLKLKGNETIGDMVDRVYEEKLEREKRDANLKIDAMDVILGIASYID